MNYTLTQYIKYYFQSVDKYKIHSPFVFDFVTKGITTQHHSHYQAIESVRNYYQSQNSSITIEDYGAGSKSSSNENSISTKKMLKNISVRKKYSRLLCNTIAYFEPKNIIELGTAFGVGTTSLGINNTHEKLISIEGNQQLAGMAKDYLPKKIANLEIVHSQFDNELPNILEQMETVDLVFIDGNHKEEATLKYFNLIKQKTNNNSILIFDDIYWSKGMTKAWNSIKKDKYVSLSLDFFQFGMIFFRKEQKEKEHFKIWY